MCNTSEKKRILDTLIRLDQAFGVSGDEFEVAEILKDEMSGLYDEHFEDVLGNQYFIKFGRKKEKKILLAAHMDEVGFIISCIREDGGIHILPVGYIKGENLRGKKLMIKTEQGKKILATATPAKLDMDAEEINVWDFILSIGTSSYEETLSLGINKGDYVSFAGEEERDEKDCFENQEESVEEFFLHGKSFDDRAGCTVLIETARRLKGVTPECTVVMVGTVQEEVGMRSGGVITNRIKPELMLALDVSRTGGTEKIPFSGCDLRVGKGPAIKYFDWDPDLAIGNNVPRKLIKAIIEVAEKNKIPYQRQIYLGGGTDAATAVIAGEGCLAGGISVPIIDMHTAKGTIDLCDLEKTAELVFQFVRSYSQI